jgi:hypothetical protein
MPNCRVRTGRYTESVPVRSIHVPEVGILIVDDDIVSQSALKGILDSEGWRVRIVPLASRALAEIATGSWNLVIANIDVLDLEGPLFLTLKDLAQSEGPQLQETGAPLRRGIRVLFLLPVPASSFKQSMLEREGLPYSLKPYHLHDFLEKVSDLLVEGGAIAEPIRSIGGLVDTRKRRGIIRTARDARRGTMFASREDYQMGEEEIADFERQEEEDKKKREKERKDREHLG